MYFTCKFSPISERFSSLTASRDLAVAHLGIIYLNGISSTNSFLLNIWLVEYLVLHKSMSYPLIKMVLNTYSLTMLIFKG